MPHDPMLKCALLLIGTLALAGCAFEQAVRRGQEEWEREQQRRADPTRAGIVSSPAQVPKSFENNDSFVLQVWNLEPAAIPNPLRIGQPVVVSVDPVWSNGVRCNAFCTVTWDTNLPKIAGWTAFVESGTKRSATLVSLAPGEVQLGVEICPAPLRDKGCWRLTWHRGVTQ